MWRYACRCLDMILVYLWLEMEVLFPHLFIPRSINLELDLMNGAQYLCLLKCTQFCYNFWIFVLLCVQFLIDWCSECKTSLSFENAIQKPKRFFLSMLLSSLLNVLVCQLCFFGICKIVTMIIMVIGNSWIFLVSQQRLKELGVANIVATQSAYLIRTYTMLTGNNFLNLANLLLWYQWWRKCRN